MGSVSFCNIAINLYIKFLELLVHFLLRYLYYESLPWFNDKMGGWLQVDHPT